ncbi:cyclopropane-fatty-acyl-phospholipid synthase family protein [Geobacter sp. DSM 9736]|uniref:SAM-dependent methyltransferase n=1 Tax=Geobacter sp. DSM 9736 TaxID=1277350 RepID=UPI000B503E2C|nr:class I SAM-dependent methyltransferase [Geobacter sp. DSM 9736]SNB47180.1 Methyltransferase domain-containing protein [Geobacter sp. DSM 9736]
MISKRYIGYVLAFLIASVPARYAAAESIFSPSAPSAGVKKDVPFVPTPTEVVERMLSMAKVTGRDIVYDLGCGDGRIVITAAKKHGARGVGIDIDPERIKESKENARAAGVTEKVRFLQQDLFKANVREATVVTMYLLNSVNLKMRPLLLSQLRPGTRIVSHSFDMGEWRPDDSSTLSQSVYYWVVPANASGRWKWKNGKEKFEMQLRQKFQQAEGTVTRNGVSFPMKNVRLSGDRLSFNVQYAAGKKPVTASFTGKIAGESIRGTIKKQSGKGVAWQARRERGTVQRIDGEGETPTAGSGRAI